MIEGFVGNLTHSQENVTEAVRVQRLELRRVPLENSDLRSTSLNSKWVWNLIDELAFTVQTFTVSPICRKTTRLPRHWLSRRCSAGDREVRLQWGKAAEDQQKNTLLKLTYFVWPALVCISSPVLPSCRTPPGWRWPGTTGTPGNSSGTTSSQSGPTSPGGDCVEVRSEAFQGGSEGQQKIP